MTTVAQLVGLLRLASPALPVGGFSYSQGLEWAVDAGVVRDEPTALVWVRQAVFQVLAGMEAPGTLRLYRAWRENNFEAVCAWNARLLAARESAELHAESVQMGYSMRLLLLDLPGDRDSLARHCLTTLNPCAWASAFSLAALEAGLDEDALLTSLLWTFAENQVMAAIKLVPLGQTAGQRLLVALAPDFAPAVSRIRTLTDVDLGNFAPLYAMACARHETQYSRLFRS